MGQRGPSRLTPEELKVRGSKLAKDRKGGPSVQAGRPACPRWLPKEAKALWRKVAREMEAAGTLTRLDGEALAGLCIAWSELQTATADVEKLGRLLTNEESGRVYANPALALQRSALAALKTYATALGLTPASRANMQLADVPQETNDPLELLLRERSDN
jgi:P27 family predicted phage terminase small subunit